MATIDEHGRPEPPPAADEPTMLSAFLDYQRATLEWKTRGLGAEGLRATLAPTTMTLGGLLKHMALVEDYWFRELLLGEPSRPPWSEADWDDDSDWEWSSAALDEPDAIRALWSASVADARTAVDRVMADGGLGQATVRPFTDGTSPTLRWILVHMIEEYARHNGHADLLRESVDGEVGE